MIKTTNAKAPFECDKSCGHVIETGETCYNTGPTGVICFSCAVTEVYGPSPDRTNE